MTPVCFPRLDLWTILGSFYSLKIIELINENREEKKKKPSIWKCLSWLEVITMNLKLVSVLLKPKPMTLLLMTSTVLPRIAIGCQVRVYVFSHVWLFETPWTVCSLPGSSVHGILQATILAWVPISYWILTDPVTSIPGHCWQSAARCVRKRIFC